MKIKRSYCAVSILFIGYVLQYNFLFSAEFLWLNYWSGSGIRTSISFLAILLFFIVYSFGLSIKFRCWSVVAVLILYFLYGLSIGLLNNEPTVGMLAEAIFWLEIALYFTLLQNLDRHALASLIRAILVYSALNGVVSVFYFWAIKDQIAVAAMVGGERIPRVADLLSPLLIHLFLLHNKIYVEKKLSNILVIPLIILVLLGMFRSVWVALLGAYFVANIVYPSIAGFRRMFFVALFGFVFVLVFEWIFEYLFNVNGVIFGRIIAGIDSQDSLGRISSAKDVLNQFFENPLYLILGAGFGKLVWFVNDFGDGEVYALQPLGSLSNYYIIFLFQVGFFMSVATLSYVFYSFFWIKKKYEKSSARLLTFVGLYFFMQWLTFPTSIHYPVALILGIYFTLAVNVMPLNSRRAHGLKLG